MKKKCFLFLWFISGCAVQNKSDKDLSHRSIQTDTPDSFPQNEEIHSQPKNTQNLQVPKECQKLSKFSDDSGDVYTCSQSKKTVLRLYIPEQLGSNNRLIQAFDTEDDVVFINLTRKISQLADEYKFNKWGFSFQGKIFENYFEMSSSYTSSNILKQQDITLDQNSPSSPAREYQAYVSQGSKYSGGDASKRQVRERTHSVSFFSDSGNRLVIPKKNYLTVYHFSKDATDAEIVDLWHHIGYETIHELDAWSRKNYKLAIHTGSAHLQTVQHFHFRLEKP